MAARDQVMSSTERAPEPTMEEILASIRRIVSDDKASSPRQRAAPQSQPDEEGLDDAEGEADDEIINDIARVLKGSGSNAAPAAGAAVDAEFEEEDILDLTAELGGLEIVEDVEEIEDIEMIEVVAEAAPEVYQPAPPRPQPVVADPEPELALLDEVADETIAADASAPQPAPEPQPSVMAESPVEPPRMSASEEAASALERAIAALRAGQLPTSMSSFSFQPQAELSPEPAPYVAAAPAYEPVPPLVASAPAYDPEAIPEPAPYVTAAPAYEPVPPLVASAPAYEPEAMPQPAPEYEPEPQPEAEPELVLAEFETVKDESVEGEASTPRADHSWSTSGTPPWARQPEPAFETEEAPEPPRVNGGSHQPYAAAGGSRSLEDSVKDMLRPMLKQWLDENMTRVLTAALKDELKDNPSRLQRD